MKHDSKPFRIKMAVRKWNNVMEIKETNNETFGTCRNINFLKNLLKPVGRTFKNPFGT